MKTSKKRFIFKLTPFLLLLIMMSQVSKAHADYYLEEGDSTDKQTTWGNDNDNRWSDSDGASKCSEIRGFQSPVRTFTFWELGNGRFDKGRISCRTMTEDGTFETGDSSYSTGNYYFNKNKEGDKKQAEVDMEMLPIGLELQPCTINNKITDYRFIQAYADDIAAGDPDPDKGSWATDSNGCGGAGSAWIDDTKEIQCQDGYVLTGVAVRHRPVEFNAGHALTGVKIRCRKLLEE